MLEVVLVGDRRFLYRYYPGIFIILYQPVYVSLHFHIYCVCIYVFIQLNVYGDRWVENISKYRHKASYINVFKKQLYSYFSVNKWKHHPFTVDLDLDPLIINST